MHIKISISNEKGSYIFMFKKKIVTSDSGMLLGPKIDSDVFQYFPLFMPKILISRVPYRSLWVTFFSFLKKDNVVNSFHLIPPG